MIRILHLINSLNTGGAEMHLTRMSARLKKQYSNDFDSRIVTLMPDGPLAKPARDAGVQVESLGLKRGSANPAALFRLRRIIQDFRPHILQTWLYHADLLGFLAGKLARVPVIFWYLQCSNMDLSQYGKATRFTVRANVLLSRRVDLLIFNSQAGMEYHLKLGYRPKRSLVIPTAVDTDIFKPDPTAKLNLRLELGLAAETPLVAVVARYDAMKGHAEFLRAAALVQQSLPNAHYLFCGDGMEPGDHPLNPLIRELELEQVVHFLGRRSDTPRIMAGVDTLCVSSLFGEGTPNVVLEAMACGTPCVVTDVGDAARVVGDTGRAVQPGDPEALGKALTEVLLLPREQRETLEQNARERIKREYSLEQMLESFVKLYTGLTSTIDNGVSS